MPSPLKGSRWPVLLAAAAMAALTARLGVWQLDRAAQKVALDRAVEQQRGLPALGWRELPAGLEAAPLHRAVLLQGRWVAEATVFLDNRQMNGRPGFYVLTPLLLDDGSAVLVQRGWLQRDFGERTRIAAPPPPPGRVQVAGRLAGPPSRLADLGPAASSPGTIRQNLAPADLARETGLALRPYTVLQETPPEAPADGLLRQWPQPAAGVHKHYGYAFQWFALSALVIVLYAWFQILRPRLDRRARR